jgi:hypothetical protein
LTAVAHSTAPHVDGFLGRAIDLLWDISGPIGEALFVSLIIAGLVEPSIRRHFAKNLGNDLFWVLSSSEAPGEFHTAIKALASLERYYVSCSWELYFEWQDRDEEVLKVRMRVRSHGMNLDPTGFRPPMNFWVMPSAKNHTSYHSHWYFEIPDRGTRYTLDSKQLKELSEGLKTWDDLVPTEARVECGKYFTSYKEAVVFPREPLIPLVHTNTALRQEFHLHGPALPELEIDLRHTGASPKEQTISANGQSMSSGEPSEKKIRRVFQDITFPGQVTLVTWEVGPSPQAQVFIDSAQAHA